LIVKGVLHPGEAAEAVAHGIDGVIVSNHGGRQLDGAPSSISMLPIIADAVGSDVEILFDGGIRSGMDVLRALALGARACLLGRAFVYGLGAGGEAGVAKAIAIIRNELDVALALTGTTSVNRVGREVIAETTR
jgi:L-lactate dehydrogenase (cytochrome)